ncbi:MAG: hypothetical protein AAGA92_11790 [Planctomycetota bacterium]
MKGIPENPAFSEAVRYWEPRRLLYNAALAAVVLFNALSGLPASMALLSVDLVLTVCLLAVIANMVYCAAYPVDVFLQYTAYADTWRRRRGVLLAIGLLTAMILTRFVAMDMFDPEV